MIKDRFCNKSDEWKELRKKVTDILYVKKNIGALATEIMWLIEDELNKEKSRNVMRPRIE